MRIYIKHTIIVFFSGALCACGSVPADDGPPSAGVSRTGSDCIFGGTVRDYRVLDDANLIVTGAGRQKYHLTLSRRAFGLRSSWNLGFYSRTGRICAGQSDIVIDEVFGPDRIRIHSIRELSPEEHEALLVRYGKIEPAVKQTREPEEVEGADVEELD